MSGSRYGSASAKFRAAVTRIIAARNKWREIFTALEEGDVDLDDEEVVDGALEAIGELADATNEEASRLAEDDISRHQMLSEFLGDVSSFVTYMFSSAVNSSGLGTKESRVELLRTLGAVLSDVATLTPIRSLGEAFSDIKSGYQLRTIKTNAESAIQEAKRAIELTRARTEAMDSLRPYMREHVNELQRQIESQIRDHKLKGEQAIRSAQLELQELQHKNAVELTRLEASGERSRNTASFEAKRHEILTQNHMLESAVTVLQKRAKSNDWKMHNVQSAAFAAILEASQRESAVEGQARDMIRTGRYRGEEIGPFGQRIAESRAKVDATAYDSDEDVVREMEELDDDDVDNVGPAAGGGGGGRKTGNKYFGGDKKKRCDNGTHRNKKTKRCRKVCKRSKKTARCLTRKP